MPKTSIFKIQFWYSLYFVYIISVIKANSSSYAYTLYKHQVDKHSEAEAYCKSKQKHIVGKSGDLSLDNFVLLPSRLCFKKWIAKSSFVTQEFVTKIGVTSLGTLKKFAQKLFLNLLFLTRVAYDKPCGLVYSR